MQQQSQQQVPGLLPRPAIVQQQQVQLPLPQGGSDGGQPKQLPPAAQQPQSDAQNQENGGEEQPKKRKRRAKKAMGDINVALYIKQQQSRGSSRKWRQEWVTVRTIVGGGEVKMLKWVTDTPPAEAPVTGLAGFANFQGFAQSRPRKPAGAATAAETKDSAVAAQQQGKPSGALSRLGSSASLDQAGAAQQPPKKKQKKAQQQQQQGAAAAAAGPPADASAAVAAAAAAAEGTVDSIPPGTEVFLPLHFPRKKRTTVRRPAAWVKSCSCFPPDAPGISTSTSGRAARPAGSSATAAGAGQDIKSLAASIAASIAADMHAEAPPGSAAAGSGSGAAGAAKGGKKEKGVAAAAAAGEGSTTAGGAALEAVIVGPPGAERYACSVCGREFATQGALRIHSNVHAAKNFACTFPGCKKAFADAKKLEKHAQRHAAAAVVLADAAQATASGASGALDS